MNSAKRKIEVNNSDSLKMLKTSDFDNTNQTVVINRPSSPRRFFERLYGHLETKRTNEDHTPLLKVTDSPKSSKSSSSSVSSMCCETNDERYS